MCPLASLVNVPFRTTLISVLVFFCSRPPRLSHSLTFLCCLFLHQAKWLLINSSRLLPPSCVLHWFYFIFLFFSCSSHFQIIAPTLWTHFTVALLLTRGGASQPSQSAFFSFSLLRCQCLFFFLSLILVPPISISCVPSLFHLFCGPNFFYSFDETLLL